MAKIKVSVVITYYQDLKKFEETLNSVIENKTNYTEVIVVDNSNNAEAKYYCIKKNVSYIKSHKNLGYGGGNNLGIANSQGDYIFILNPDTLIYKNTIKNLKAFLDSNLKTAVVAPNMIKPNGEIYEYFGSSELTPVKGIFSLGFMNKLFPNSRIAREYWLKDLDNTKTRKVDVVPGSALMIRKSAFEKIGFYDENLFIYFEESDIGKRFKDSGWETYILSTTKILHHWKFGRKENPTNKMHFENSRFYYFKKHFGMPSALIVEIFAKINKIFAFFFDLFSTFNFIYSNN